MICKCPKCGEDELIMSFKSYNAYNGNISYWGVECESCGFTVRSEKSVDHARFLWESAGNKNILKPCPFCGWDIGDNQPFITEKEVGHDLYSSVHAIQCDECGVMMYGETREEVIEKWNRRVKE